MPRDLTGNNVWVDPVTVPLDGEIIEMVGTGGTGNARIYQRLADRDVFMRTRITTMEVRALPMGGEAGDILIKRTSADYDASWAALVGIDGGTF